MIIVSLVTGTYNRLQYLQSMVTSFRNSIGVGITYEIIVVDGGSDDGTIMWCLNQSDVKLIEQGELLGAVRAFNEGAYAANGKYVILANDDIEFLGDSILYAIRHMEDTPICGIGCFYQDRNGHDFHVEQMPVVSNGQQASYHYGQVCIVRKELGDEVGWWGNYLHTYGGDNELSCNVLELGWDVQPIKCACIHDKTPADALRKRNNEVAKVGVGNNHPDTQKWLNKWTRNGFVGPTISQKSAQYIHTKLYRFLYLPIYEQGNVLQHKTKHGLRDALANYGIVYEIDYVDEILANSKQYFLQYMLDMFEALQPDIVLTQFHDARTVTINDLYELKRHTTAKWVNWNGDYHPEHLYDNSYMMLMKMYDLVGVVTTAVAPTYNPRGIPWVYWQIGYEESKNSPSDVKKHDVVFLANGYSKERQMLAARLRGLTGVNVGLYGHWAKELRPDGECVYNFDIGHKLYTNAKIAISDAQWPEVTGYVSNRLFQAMVTGVCLFQQYFDGMDMLGLVHDENCVVWKDVYQLEAYIRKYLQVPERLAMIGRNGKALVEKYHSFDNRVTELLELMKMRNIL